MKMRYKLRYGRLTPEKFGWIEIIGCYPFYLAISDTKPPRPVFANGDGSFGFEFVPLSPDHAKPFMPKYTAEYVQAATGRWIWHIYDRDFMEVGHGVVETYPEAQAAAERYIKALDK